MYHCSSRTMSCKILRSGRIRQLADRISASLYITISYMSWENLDLIVMICCQKAVSHKAESVSTFKTQQARQQVMGAECDRGLPLPSCLEQA